MTDVQPIANGTNGETVDQKIDKLAIAVKAGFDGVDKRFDGIEKRLDGVEGRLDGVEGRLDGVEGKMDGMTQRLTRIEATMVTKSYLDEKLFSLKGDLIENVRKLDRHLAFLEDLLKARSVLSDADVARGRAEFRIFPIGS